MFWFVCFLITVGSADSAGDLSLSFLPVICSISAPLMNLMSSQVQLTHILPLCPTSCPSAGLGTNSPATHGRAAQAMFMPSFILFTSSSSNKLAAVWKLLFSYRPECFLCKFAQASLMQGNNPW